jgi:hypothetical protein
MSFETQNSLPSNSYDSSFFDSDDEKPSKSTKIPKKKKNISRAPRTRKLKENSKWSHKDDLKFWKFYVFYQTQKPYQKISWIKWKRDSIYKHMATFIGKTAKQCKSKDQNMKSK